MNTEIQCIKGISRNQQVVFEVVAAWHSLQSTCSPGETPGHLHQSMDRGRGKHLCRICKQNQLWLSAAVEPDSGILGLETGEDVNDLSSHITRSVGIQGFEAVVELEHERQTYGHLGSCHGQDKDKHYLAVNLSPSRAGDHKGQTHGVQHHFNGHEHEHDVPAHEHARETEHEQYYREEEAVFHGHMCDH